MSVVVGVDDNGVDGAHDNCGGGKWRQQQSRTWPVESKNKQINKLPPPPPPPPQENNNNNNKVTTITTKTSKQTNVTVGWMLFTVLIVMMTVIMVRNMIGDVT